MNSIRSGFGGIILRATALATLIWLTQGVSALHAEPKWPLPEGIKSVAVNGYEMAYRDEGSGAPVVLVHGALGDYRIWTPVGAELSKRFHVITVSLRHHY